LKVLPSARLLFRGLPPTVAQSAPCVFQACTRTSVLASSEFFPKARTHFPTLRHPLTTLIKSNPPPLIVFFQRRRRRSFSPDIFSWFWFLDLKFSMRLRLHYRGSPPPFCCYAVPIKALIPPSSFKVCLSTPIFIFSLRSGPVHWTRLP